MDNLRFYLSTYNVGTSTPDQDLKELLSLSDQTNENRPDFFVLGFQEVKAQPQNVLMDTLFDDPWSEACKELLKQEYVKLKSLRLQGLLLIVFSLRKHLLNIREIDRETTRTGLNGMWGNKGAVALRLSIYGFSFCFVNAHFCAHECNLKDRIRDYNNIIEDQWFHVQEPKIFDHDFVFWMGDLNFRLIPEYEESSNEVISKILKGDFKTILEFDELRHVLQKDEALSELKEQLPNFPPTFKFDVGTSNYNPKRRPAWCDRILYRINLNKHANGTLKVDPLSYNAHLNYSLSDHKPVTAEFLIKLPKLALKLQGLSLDDKKCSDYSKSVIQFDEIKTWCDEGENKASFNLARDISVGDDDWIGFFKENFSALDEFDAYEYVIKCSQPIESSYTSSNTIKYEIVFPDLPNKSKGNYCLLYIAQTEDKVTSILGMSNAFSIVKY